MPREVPAVNEDALPPGADRMPTLTEVLELDAPHRVDESEEPSGAPEAATAPQAAEVPAPPQPLAGPIAVPDTAALVSEVLAELLPRIDMLFESRLREALAPALARAAAGLIHDARGELGSTLHALVDDAVRRALQRRSERW